MKQQRNPNGLSLVESEQKFGISNLNLNSYGRIFLGHRFYFDVLFDSGLKVRYRLI